MPEQARLWYQCCPNSQFGTTSTTPGTKISSNVERDRDEERHDSRVYSPIGQRRTWQTTNIAAPTGGVVADRRRDNEDQPEMHRVDAVLGHQRQEDWRQHDDEHEPSMKVPAARMKRTISTTTFGSSVTPSIQAEITSGMRSKTMP